MAEAKSQAQFKIITFKVQEHRLEKAWIRFENAGFKPLLIKGWAAAQLYPEPFNRSYNDIDLIIAPEKYDEALMFLESVKEELDSQIDLHKNAKLLDKLPFENLFARSEILMCGKTPIRVLSREDHLRVLAVHWLIDGGAKKDKLWDIYYAVENRPADFDWDRCLNAAGQKRRQWVICAILIAHTHLGLNIKNTPKSVQEFKIPAWVNKALEKEWQSSVKIIPLHYCLNDRRELWQQIKKRIPPNAIQATVETEGEFNDSPRIYNQILDVFKRLKPSLGRIIETKNFR